MSDDELGKNLVPFCNTQKPHRSLLRQFGMGFLSVFWFISGENVGNA